jgi:hypothetical protein
MDKLKMVAEKLFGRLLFAAWRLGWRWRWCFQGLRYLSGVHPVACARVTVNNPPLPGSCWVA